ncbi:methyltransferase regulatory domain-containing protein [Pasteurella testudinis]|uniref:methyltransferase regulatory domain-containing protein n=1 Tax=Pasteurella testudinis TaxID=761 RepID=UPI0040586B8A
MDNPLLQENAKTYDDFPYLSHPFAKSLPSLHQAIGKLFGLNPPDLTRARVLELGCASGGNIIPLTFFYPELQVVGVDLSQVQINEGRKIVAAMGLQNRVQLHHLSITDIPDDFGEFDYIICHGVYSWVPDFVQTGIFEVIRKQLKADGIAYISYNVYPGWKSLEIARDAMLFHTRDIQDSTSKVDNAKAMIRYMHQKARKDSMFKRIMDDVDQLVQNSAPYYLAHEFLEIHNSPLYFTDMVKKAAAHQLFFLNEAEISSSFAENWGNDVHADLIKASHNDQLVVEQYLDYINNRQFRQSLFIPQVALASLNRHLSAEAMQNSCFSVSVAKESTPRAEMPQHTHFIFNHLDTLFYRTQNSREIEALEVLCQFNQLFFDFQTYEDAVKTVMQAHYNREFVTHLLLKLVVSGLLHICGTPPISNRPVNVISATPQVAELNRRYLALRDYIVNARNEMLKPDLIQSLLIPYLDGQHSEADLSAVLLQAHADGKIKFNHNSPDAEAVEVTDAQEIEKLAGEFTRNALLHLRENGMLIG